MKLRKGSPEAKAWGERMQALRKKAKHRPLRPGEGRFPMARVFAGKPKSKILKQNPRSVVKRNGPIEARELYLFATNDSELYQRVERRLIRQFGQDYREGKWNRGYALSHWKAWARDAARLYTEQFGSRGLRVSDIFTIDDIAETAMKRVQYWETEFSLGNFIDNPKRYKKNLVRVCAWCGKQLGEISPISDRRETHGICEQCMTEQLSPVRRDAERRTPKKTRNNPIAVYGLGNPGSRTRARRPQDNPSSYRATIEGVIYNRCLEVRAEKTGSFKPGFYRHPFATTSRVQVLALDNGDILLHSTHGKKLWSRP